MLLRMWPTRVERGLAQFECVPDESAYNPIGVVHGGLVCTLADSVAGCAVHTTLDAGIALATAEIHDGAGLLVATASSNCLVFPL
jgi:uncharacterized protein (TIGR00369 family)